jgi:hypothetical protein
MALFARTMGNLSSCRCIHRDQSACPPTKNNTQHDHQHHFVESKNSCVFSVNYVETIKLKVSKYALLLTSKNSQLAILFLSRLHQVQWMEIR